MRYVGVDLHKRSISLCVVELVGRERKIVDRRRFDCRDEEPIAAYFAQLGSYQAVVEATASYEWFVKLIERTADRVVLAHPGKLRVIAESTRKTDKLDAQTLAEFLALDQIPESWRPTPRVREHRALVRHRAYVQGRITAAKNKLRRIVAHYNADRTDLFSRAGRAYLATIELSAADRFVANMLCEDLDAQSGRLKAVDKRLQQFAAAAPLAEREARAVLASVPGVGPVTTEVVLAEAGDVRRFTSQRKATAYAGLAPGVRQSDQRTKQLGITKTGSPLLRTILVETAWRLTNKTRRWGALYERLKKRCGAKKAIVAGSPPRLVRDRVAAEEWPSVPTGQRRTRRLKSLCPWTTMNSSLSPRSPAVQRPITQRRRRPRARTLPAASQPTDARMNGGAFRKHASRRAPWRAAPRIDG